MRIEIVSECIGQTCFNQVLTVHYIDDRNYNNILRTLCKSCCNKLYTQLGNSKIDEKLLNPLTQNEFDNMIEKME